MDRVTLVLEAKEFEYVLNVLAQRPYAEVTNLINNLAQQANVKKQEPETPPQG
jgi:hypothetical protein